jgi:hypothetical protein
MKPNYKEGDLVCIVRSGTFTLCQLLSGDIPAIRECPVKELEVKTHPRVHRYDDIYKNLEGKVGLVVYVARNKLEQPLGYRVLIEGHEMFCKSKVAQKYFKLAENQGDESRGLSPV